MDCFHTRVAGGPEEHDMNVRRTSAERGIRFLLVLPRSAWIYAGHVYACGRRHHQSASPAPRTWRSPRIDPLGSQGACSPRRPRIPARQRYRPDRAPAGSVNGHKEPALPRQRSGTSRTPHQSPGGFVRELTALVSVTHMRVPPGAGAIPGGLERSAVTLAAPGLLMLRQCPRG